MQFDQGFQTKLIEMYEAREAILNRLNSDAFRPDAESVIDIDRFLQTAVTEMGQRLAVDRCNVITPSPAGGFRVSHEYLGIIGLQYCHQPHEWTETEIRLVEWLAGQVSIGLQYTRLYNEKEKEVEITKALLEVSNDINTRTDFNQITTFVIDRALEL